MPGEAIDHLLAVVILGGIFMGAVFVVPSLSYISLLYLDQQQLRNVALSVFKTILFDEGYPTNWGSMHGLNLFNENDVTRFGLALGNRSLYVLDMNKVQRLANNPMGNISYQRVKDLLGLSGYDFSIIMRPLFKVDKYVSPTVFSNGGRSATISFNVNISRYDGQPVPNAYVTTVMIYVVGKSTPVTNIMQVKKTTDALGHCEGSAVVNADETITDIVVIFRITVGDRSSLVVQAEDTQTPDNICKVNVVGDNVILTNPPNHEEPPYPSRWVMNIQMFNFETSMNMLNGTRGNDYKLTYGGGYNLWSQTFEGLEQMEPAIMILTIDGVEKNGGRQLIILVGPWGLWSQGGVLSMNAVQSSSGSSVSIQRDVIISGMAYLAELRLWKT